LLLCSPPNFFKEFVNRFFLPSLLIVPCACRLTVQCPSTNVVAHPVTVTARIFNSASLSKLSQI
jgi:hypothetical protein